MKKILPNVALRAAFVAFVVPILASACSSADIYQMRQENAQDTCRRLPEPDCAACLTRNAGDYAGYKKQKDALDSSEK